MTVKEIVRKVSADYHIGEDELLKSSIREFLFKRKYEIEKDIIDIFGQYKVNNLQELEEIVISENEHPVWEDLITVENLYEKLSEIKSDICALS